MSVLHPALTLSSLESSFSGHETALCAATLSSKRAAHCSTSPSLYQCITLILTLTLNLALILPFSVTLNLMLTLTLCQ